MDRRNGGDPLAPPRPPKLLPRIHRPRAPEPTIMGDSSTVVAAPRYMTKTATVTTPPAQVLPWVNLGNNSGTSSSDSSNSSSTSSSNNNLNKQQLLQPQQSQTNQQLYSITTTAAATTSLNNTGNSSITGSITNNNNNNSNSNSNANVTVIYEPEDDGEIHHLTFLPQRPTTLSLNRNTSHVSSSSTSSSASSGTAATTVSSFTRRRLPPTPGSAVPLLTIAPNVGSTNNNHINSNNFLNHFHNADQVPASAVTLAQPRPESERLTNEYVDTPLRTAQQLQHATRMQHPAGQHDSGQTTTNHLLLLPQRELRLQQQLQQQQQQHHQHQQHSNRLAGTAGSANATTGTDGTDGGFLHSYNHKSPLAAGATTTTTTTLSMASLATSPFSSCPHTGKTITSSQPVQHSFGTPGVQTITTNQQHQQPIITKQPASSAAINNCKFAKDLPAFDDIHSIATGIPTSQGISVSAVGGGVTSPLGTPIFIGGSPATFNPTTCPRCERCRCEQCQSPRPLPQTWVCNKTCLCSAESVIDYASCLCCAKALFYHCARDSDMDYDDGSDTPCVDNPCSCGPYKRMQRWGWLGALSLVLPCLWCYWPMRGCVALCEKCYGRIASRGCRCQQVELSASMLPIVQLGVNGNNMLSNGGGHTGQNGNMTGTQTATAKSVSGTGHHHHNHHHTECSAANRILRKGDLTPEKRLLDSTYEY